MNELRKIKPRSVVALPDPRLRFWSVALFFASGLLIVVLVATVMVVRNLARSSADSPSFAEEIVPSPPPNAIAPNDGAAKVLAPKSIKSLPKTTLAVTAKVPFAAPPAPIPQAEKVKPIPPVALPKPKDDGAAEAEARVDLLWETVGSFTSSQLYQSYLNLGLIADAVERETYTKEEAQQIVGTLSALMDIMKSQLQRLEKTADAEDDRLAVRKALVVAEAIKAQSHHLQEYWNTQEKIHIDEYHKVREQTWTALRAVLGLTDEKEQP